MKLLPLLVLLCVTMPATAGTARIDPDLEKAVTALANLVGDGYTELDEGPAYSVSSDGITAVVFALQGPAKGNGTWQFLATFVLNADLSPEYPAASKYRLLAFKRIGNRGVRLFDGDSASFHHGRLRINGQAYRPGDPLCCPSLPIRASFDVRDDQIQEQPLAARSEDGPASP